VPVTAFGVPAGHRGQRGLVAAACASGHYGWLVRLIIARCSVDYSGRLTAHLPLATRLIAIKADGSVLIHSDTGTRALSWMPPGSWVSQGEVKQFDSCQGGS
jgi:RecB family endonuclease NucS